MLLDPFLHAVVWAKGIEWSVLLEVFTHFCLWYEYGRTSGFGFYLFKWCLLFLDMLWCSIYFFHKCTVMWSLWCNLMTTGETSIFSLIFEIFLATFRDDTWHKLYHSHDCALSSWRKHMNTSLYCLPNKLPQLMICMYLDGKSMTQQEVQREA